MLTLNEIQAIYRPLYVPDYGSVNDVELEFIQKCIEGTTPELFVEIGVASGISTGFIARFMNEFGGGLLQSIDINEKFYADETKATGFLVDSIYKMGATKLNIHLKKSALDLAEILGNKKFDMCFIDANHAHPWPTLDTMAVLPFAKPNAPILHHDLSLYKNQRPPIGIGPKYLFDQFPSDQKEIIGHSSLNIGYFRAPIDNYLSMEERLLTSLGLPWTKKIHPYFVTRFKSFLLEKWGRRSAAAFDAALMQFNN